MNPARMSWIEIYVELELRGYPMEATTPLGTMIRKLTQLLEEEGAAYYQQTPRKLSVLNF